MGSSLFFLLTLLFPVCLFCKNGENLPLQKMIPFSLADVSLMEGPFRHAMKMDGKWLLSFDPDRFLSGFRSESGLKPKAPKYGGWESQGVAGQTFGHYLSAMAMMYASTGDKQFNDKIKYSINELDTCQQAFGMNGLVAAFPRAKGVFGEIAKGDIRTDGFDLNGAWVPLYTTDKLFAGLIDVYHFTGNKQAYKILINLAGGLNRMLSGLTDDQMQKILICEHGGINESVAEVYALSGDPKYIRLAERLNHKAILEPLARHRDELAGKHANTQIPKVIGVMREYELTGNPEFLSAASYFWDEVVGKHSYVIGGNSESEHFGVPDRTYDRITDKTCENCNTYNMLKLTKHMFMLDGDVKKADYYERALYNQILASQNPETGMVCYMSPLATGSNRNFSTPFESFWCCVGTGIENHSRYGEFIYFSNPANDLFVNLFIPSCLSWKARNVELIQETGFPASDTIRFKLRMGKKQKFTLNLRYPGWSKKSCEIFVNGKKTSLSANPGCYIPLERTWSDSDEVIYILPKSFSSESALGDESLRAYLYGPIVLSGIMDDKEKLYPVIVTDNFKDASSVIEATSEPLSFKMKTAHPYAISLKPYYETSGEKLMVYFEHYTTKDWQENRAKILKKQDHELWLKEQVVSDFRPGEMQPERDHNFKGERTETGEMNGRKYRKTAGGGWFSFDMAVLPDQPVDLMATFWGNLGDIYKFNIEVDRVSVATVIIHWWGSQFFDKTYHIPENLTKGKEKITITYRALNEKTVAGPLFNCKILKQ